MTEALNGTSTKPGPVIFVAILNFFSSAAWFFGMAFFAVLLIFGNTVGFYQTVTDQLQQQFTAQNLSIGLNAFFIFFLLFSSFFALLHLSVGVGLLKGKPFAWYIQIVTSVMGLILVPYGTVISVVILIFFFRSNVRSYFKV